VREPAVGATLRQLGEQLVVRRRNVSVEDRGEAALQRTHFLDVGGLVLGVLDSLPQHEPRRTVEHDAPLENLAALLERHAIGTFSGEERYESEREEERFHGRSMLLSPASTGQVERPLEPT